MEKEPSWHWHGHGQEGDKPHAALEVFPPVRVVVKPLAQLGGWPRFLEPQGYFRALLGQPSWPQAVDERNGRHPRNFYEHDPGRTKGEDSHYFPTSTLRKPEYRLARTGSNR